MIKIFKSNKLISLILIIMCIIIMINPVIYAKSCLNAISVWSVNVLPLLFPFFIFTRLIIGISNVKKNFLDKYFSKAYHVPQGSLGIFCLATISGYPMGAKIVSSLYESNQVSTQEAKKMLSFCSVSGPMFMLGTVGIAMLKSYTAGIIIVISNIVASLVNGLIHRGKTEKHIIFESTQKTSTNLLHDSVYDSIVAILMIGAYIVLSFLVVDMLNNIHFLPIISNFFANILKIPCGLIKAFLTGTIEITRGILDLSTLDVNLKLKTIIASGLIGFGGISILLQSLSFLSNLKIPVKNILIQKSTQSILCVLISALLVTIFM